MLLNSIPVSVAANGILFVPLVTHSLIEQCLRKVDEAKQELGEVKGVRISVSYGTPVQYNNPVKRYSLYFVIDYIVTLLHCVCCVSTPCSSCCKEH